MQALETDALLGDNLRRYSSYRPPRSRRTDSAVSQSVSAESASISTTASDEDLEIPMLDLTMLQACVFVEDAIMYHSIHHRVDKKSLELYRAYYSKPAQWFLYSVIFLIHILAFFESPSSLSWSSDIRYRHERISLPCGLTETIELLCLLALLVDVIIKAYLKGKKEFFRSRWLLAYVLVIFVSLIDWCVTLGNNCSEEIRFRRMLRPFFLLQNSSLMKKTVNCLRRTLPQIISVLLLLAMHLYFFTLFGLLLFPREKKVVPIHNGTLSHTKIKKQSEENLYFNNLPDALMNLLVLLTTANNPDVTMPAYSENRLFAIYFIVFLVIGVYCLMNMLTAVIYNQFRGYFLNSMQSSLFRRHLAIRAAYEVLRQRHVALPHRSNLSTVGSVFHSMIVSDIDGTLDFNCSGAVPVAILRDVVNKAKIPISVKHRMFTELNSMMGCMLNPEQFHEVFAVLDTENRLDVPDIVWCRNVCCRVLQTICAHKYFTYCGCGVAFINVICISVELGTAYAHDSSSNSALAVANLVFIIYYIMEQSLKMWALGWKRYSWDRGNLFDGFITVILAVIQMVYIGFYGVTFWSRNHLANGEVTLWELVRIINILIIVRLFRITMEIKAMFVVMSTLFDLIRNLRAFAGILVVTFYSFAILGMELFKNKIVYDDQINKTECGSYEQLQYWANNFDDFAASLVLLWDVMVVNNWHVFLQAYSKYTNKWSQIYFIAWWLISVVICLNLFTALILENFIMRWENQQRHRRDRADSTDSPVSSPLSVHDMFRESLQEPTESELLSELRHHPHLQFAV